MMNNMRKNRVVAQGSLEDVKERVTKKQKKDAEKNARIDENEAVQGYQCLIQFLKPLVYSMIATGLYFTTVDGIPVSPIGLSALVSQKKWAVFRSTFVYNLIIVGLLLTSLIKIILAFFIGDIGSEFTTFKVIGTFWLILCFLNAVLMLKASHPRTGSLLKFFKFWNTAVLDNFRKLNIVYDKPKTHFKLQAGLIAVWLVIFSHTALAAVLTFGRISPVTDKLGAVFIMPMPVNTLSKSFTFIVDIFCTFAWILPYVFFIIICIIVKNGFYLLTAAVKQEMKNCPHVYAPKLQMMRKTHVNLCRCVEILDKDFRWLFASWFIINVPLGCFTLYNAVSIAADTLTVVISLFWMLNGMFGIAITSAFAATLSEAAHSPQQYIYDICLDDVTVEKFGQVNLFMSKLNGPAIGFTVLTLVTITKELLLAVAGLFLTYFFLLLQFKV